MRMLVWCCLLATLPARGQWDRQTSNTTASLRGIDAVNDNVAWASGTKGTVLRTVDGGAHWAVCTIPSGAEQLDFRAVQAFDQQRALVMSSGPGDLSRVYRTSNGCASWLLVLTNPDAPDGFFDGMRFDKRATGSGHLIGDPAKGHFALFVTHDWGRTWKRESAPAARTGESLFAASNSSLWEGIGSLLFVTGGQASRAFRRQSAVTIPMQTGDSAGAFSIAEGNGLLMAVGGDYRRPDAADGNCAVSSDNGHHWSACHSQPHGYRSAVAFDPGSQTWIAVGTNGTDISSDGARTWSFYPTSGPKWNALSLPFVVGAEGCIGKRSRSPRGR